jgi:pyruvate/2-oxoacid:ferredoxin oxidoreductase beta subunit
VPDVAEDVRSVRLQADGRDSLQPWQFFVLAALGCATAVTFVARGQGVTAVILLSVLMGAAGLVGMAALRALRPLVSADDDRTAMVGQRTRVALEREKNLTLRAIKELEFDKAMGKVSAQDFDEMAARLRARALDLMKRLDEGATPYRDVIEKELAQRLGRAPEAVPAASAANTCACGTANDRDARFCKSCGSKLRAA